MDGHSSAHRMEVRVDPFLIAAFALLALSYWLLRPSRTAATVSPVASPAAESQRRAITTELARMELRIAEQSRELEANLQTRVALLDQLIADADERIADLRSQVEFRDEPPRRRAA